MEKIIDLVITLILYILITAIVSILGNSNPLQETTKARQTLLPTTYSEEAKITTGGGGGEIIASNTGMVECPALGE